jgi:hypothetical protein
LAKLRIAALALGITLGVGASWMGFWGVAAEDNNPPSPDGVVPHRHFTLKDDGAKVYVGPNFCANAATEQGWAAYHWNVHRAQAGIINEIIAERC